MENQSKLLCYYCYYHFTTILISQNEKNLTFHENLITVK